MTVLLEQSEDGCTRLFIDGDLQFDSRDERIYHECLALPAAALAQRRFGSGLHVLVVGGGDGLAAREILKSPSVNHIDLVDYDLKVISLARSDLHKLNGGSLTDHRVSVHIQDARDFVKGAIETGKRYELVVCDLTVPQDEHGAALHSIEWYARVRQLLRDGGVIAVNGASPWATPRAYWSICHSMTLAGIASLPYHIVVPSFRAEGYGPDWGFVLGSTAPLSLRDLDHGLPLPAPRRELKDTTHLRQLFVFPEALLALREEAAAAHEESNILLHYLLNDQPLGQASGKDWDALSQNWSLLPCPKADSTRHLLPPEICSALGAANLTQEEEESLFFRVVEMMPVLRRDHTRRMIADFLSNPSTFLESIDLPGLVDRLLKRAAELPAKFVCELELLQNKLADWCDDHVTLLNLGSRVLTVVTVVVILGNLLYPDAAYGKGEHGGGHGGAGHHGDGRGGDRLGRGDRGDRGDRGFRGDRHDFDHHFDNFGHWNHWNRWNHWGGWARPWHSWYWGGWGGGWWVPTYAGGGGFLNVNVNDNSQTVDEEGTAYPARKYCYVQNYSYDDQGPPPDAVASGPPPPAGANTQDGQVQQDDSDYRLGPDTDILQGGKVAINLTDSAYLLVTPDATLVMDQGQGTPIMSLYNDPSLIWHLSSEIKRQSLGLQSAAQSKQSAMDWSGRMGFKSQGTSDEQREWQNIQGTVDLLNQASQYLGTFADQPPPVTEPPVAGAIEVFASVWMTADGTYLIIKRPDGSLAYLDSRGWYSDAGNTRLAAPYPTKFKAVAIAYLTTLSQEAASTQARLAQDQQDASQRLQMLTSRFQQMQSGGFSIDGQPVMQGSNINPEAVRRLRQAIMRTQRRLDGIQKQLNTLPQEITAANKMLTALQSS